MKHGKREMPREHQNHKGLTALVALVLILCCAVGGTVAWLTTSTSPVTNTFTPTEVKTTIEENFDGKTKSNVVIRNTSDIPVYMRAAIIINWADADGNVYPKTVATSDYQLKIGSQWKKVGDFYYYIGGNPQGVAPANDEHSKENDPRALIVSCQRTGNVPADDYDLQVTILAEAIQADGKTSSGTKAVQDAWGVDPTTLLS